MPRTYNTPENDNRRKYAFYNKITSTHWPIPMRYASNNMTNKELFEMDSYKEDIFKLL